jgi:hypothetical protein
MQALRFLDSQLSFFLLSSFLKVGKPNPNILPWPNPARRAKTLPGTLWMSKTNLSVD